METKENKYNSLPLNIIFRDENVFVLAILCMVFLLIGLLAYLVERSQVYNFGLTRAIVQNPYIF